MSYFNFVNKEIKKRIDDAFSNSQSYELDVDEWAELKLEIQNLEMILDEFVEAFNGDLQHVIPVGDVMEHDSSMDCWCGPQQCHGSPKVVIHNAMDGREDNELVRH